MRGSPSGALDGPIRVLIDDPLRNRKRTPMPSMRDRHFGPPPGGAVTMIRWRLVKARPGELHEVRHPGAEVFKRLLAGVLLQEVPYDVCEVARPR